MILSSQSIRKLHNSKELISPFVEGMVGRVTSYGLSVAGYDLRAEFDSKGLVSEVRIQPGQFFLLSTIEKVSMPNHLMGVIHDKSSWARKGLSVQNTVIEPGWRGYITLEINNHGYEEVVIQRGDGICQIVFHELDEEAEHPYDSKYQDQKRGPQKALSRKLLED